jgi:hypothetical protein
MFGLVLASRAVKERKTVIESLLMKPSELPGTRSLYRLTNRALIKIKELGNMPARMSFLRTLSSRLKLRP